ncbi:hypothetical protein Pfo_010533 [Paulownia fortunei]|nr:hypothetical protein Pfo_010533 [Paulownia fortunei]
MEESREENIVYMQRPTEISHSLSTSRNPVKRQRCREDSSVAWCNLDKTKSVKEYRCPEFDDYIRKADSSPDFHPMGDLKHGPQENAIISDFEFEIQEQDKELQSSGEVQERTTSGAKRIRWLYLPENANSLENSVLHPESLGIPPLPSKVHNSSLKPSLAAEPMSSKSTECDSYASNLDNPDSEVSQPSAGVNRKNLRELITHNDQQRFNVDLKDQNRDGTDNKTGEYLAFEVKELTQSAFFGNCLEVTSSYLDMETALVDVHLTVKASYRAENVPFVCLTSKLNGKAILGYPLEIGELSDSCETLLPRKESVARKLFDDEGSRFHQLVWRTSKRTPVCYVTNSLSSSISKNVQGGQASKNVEDSIPLARENGLLIKEKSLTKLLKNPNQFNQGKAALSRTCVPVELIFSKILAAVGQVQC